MSDQNAWEYWQRLVIAQLADDKTDIANLHLDVIELKRKHAEDRAQRRVYSFIWGACVAVGSVALGHFWK